MSRSTGQANEGTRKKVILISLAFPPTPQVGALRVGKLAEYLPSVGWTPFVLTLPVRDYTPIRNPVTGKTLEPLTYRGKPENLFQIPAVNPFTMASAIRRSMTSARPVEAATQHAAEPVAAAGPSWRYRLGRMAHNVLVPDEYAHWVIRATVTGKRIIAREKPNAIWAFFPHASNLLAGYLLSRRSGVPLIVDFRDPWTGFVNWVASPAWRNSIDSSLERRILEHAKILTVVNEGVADDIVLKVPEAASKIRSLPQGIDFGEAATIGDDKSSRPFDGIFRIGYGGTLSRNLGDPERFLNALGRVMSRGVADRGKVRVFFVGHSTLDLQSLAQNAGVSDLIETNGHMERYQSLRMLARADLLLLINDRPGKVWITGKIWDYLTLRRPILALVDPESAAAQVLESTRTGRVVAPWDDEAIEGEITRAITEFMEKKTLAFEPDEKMLEQYSMTNVARTAAAILESV